MSRYEVVFSGQLVPGTAREQAEEGLARLFQADARRIAALFSGQRVVIKQNLDQAGAERYRQALARVGAVATVMPMPEALEEIELAPPPADERPRAEPPRPRLQVIPRDDYMAAFRHVDAPDFGLFPEGADLQDARPATPPPPLDLSALSLAPAGSDMGETRRTVTPVVPDIGHLSLRD